MEVTVLGASGFVGRALCTSLAARGDTVRHASLRDPDRAAAASAGSDAVINLAGAPIAVRWTAANRRAIFASRIDLPRAYLAALARTATPPSTYVSMSAIGYYGTHATATFVETDPPGNDVLATICAGWEREAAGAAALGMRVAIVRAGLVLGPGGGALAKLLPVFRFGLGGVIASGEQWYSWIHLDDLIGIILLALDRSAGVLNATAPHPVTNREFTRALGRAVHRPTPFPVPEFALRLLLGDGEIVLTGGQRVLPHAALAAGYTFHHPELDAALQSIMGAG